MNLEHIEILELGTVAWSKWRKVSPEVKPDLTGADLSKRDFSGYDFCHCDFQGGNLSDSVLKGANLLGADLRRVDLSGADLAEAENLLPKQLAASNLSRCKLPSELDLAPGLAVARESSEAARNTFFLLLGACIYSWLTIAGSTDAVLLTNSVQSPLPIIGTEIPILRFFIVAPAILFVFYLYWQTLLMRMWSAAASLPAIYSDGEETQTRANPWLLTRLWQRQRPFVTESAFSSFEWVVAHLSVWWLVPMTIFSFWYRCLVIREWPVTFFLVVLGSLGICLNLCASQVAERILRGESARKVSWRRLFAIRGAETTGGTALACFLVLLIASYYSIGRLPMQEANRLYSSVDSDCPSIWSPGERANLRYEELSEQASARDGARGAEFRAVDLRFGRLFRAYLENADLREAALQFAHIQEADLSGADLGEASLLCTDLKRARLNGANLSYLGTGGVLERTATILRGADLRAAELRDADLRRTDLSGANLGCVDKSLCTNLSGADLREANLSGASLVGANLYEVDLRGARGISEEQLAKACGDDSTKLDPGLADSMVDAIRKAWRSPGPPCWPIRQINNDLPGV